MSERAVELSEDRIPFEGIEETIEERFPNVADKGFLRWFIDESAKTNADLFCRFGPMMKAVDQTDRLHEIGAHYTYSEVPYDRVFSDLTGRGLNARLGLERPFLHAWRLGLDHPFTGERIAERIESAIRDPASVA